MKNPQTTIATTFLTHIISAIDGVSQSILTNVFLYWCELKKQCAEKTQQIIFAWWIITSVLPKFFGTTTTAIHSTQLGLLLWTYAISTITHCFGAQWLSGEIQSWLFFNLSQLQRWSGYSNAQCTVFHCVSNFTLYIFTVWGH